MLNTSRICSKVSVWSSHRRTYEILHWHNSQKHVVRDEHVVCSCYVSKVSGNFRKNLERSHFRNFCITNVRVSNFMDFDRKILTISMKFLQLHIIVLPLLLLKDVRSFIISLKYSISLFYLHSLLSHFDRFFCTESQFQ